MKLLFNKPARTFTETLPIGNGRLGALIYGEVMREQVVLNESSMWSGSPEASDREDAHRYLPEIRRLLSEGKNYEAEQVFHEHFTCQGKGTNYAHGSTVPFGCYQLLGRMHLSYFQALSSGKQDSCCVRKYKRELDLITGTARLSFKLGQTTFVREWIASEDPDALLLHLTASKPGMIHVGIGLDRDERFETVKTDDRSICMSGQLADGYGTDHGVRYACVAGAAAKRGSVYTEGNRLYIRDADEALIVIAAATDRKGFMGKKDCDPVEKAKADCVQALYYTGNDNGGDAGNTDPTDSTDNSDPVCVTAVWNKIYREHCRKMSAVMSRMQLEFGKTKEYTTPKRIRRFLKGKSDPNLAALYVEYARYLLYSCSREGGLAANLQGIWADEVQTPWNGDWHLNAQQMIYWLAEKGNLSESHLPYLELTDQLTKPGKRTARAYYGADGWLVHTCTNPWGFTSPCEDAAWGSTTGSPAWLCHHLWEHYLYTLDEEYLSRVYPVMQEAAQFYLALLVEDAQGRLVTSPSSSPENLFLDEKGRKCALCQGPAYDRELIRSLFQSCLEAQYVLNDDPGFRALMEETIPRLAPVEIASDGRIMEWDREYPEAMAHHRHLSHLWGVYPGQLITPEHEKKLSKAAEKSLKMRGRTTVGWAIAHRMCLWARLRNGKKAWSCVKDMFRYATGSNLMNLAYHCDETTAKLKKPDLRHSRYPFQIDGNEGNAAGILMMLEDDYAHVRPDGSLEIEIHLLPALPPELKTGKITGLRIKGNMSLDMEWEEGAVKWVTVRSLGAVEFPNQLQEQIVTNKTL
ncbi:MAG: glycosyl hydrolase family 95 catalytic domain-containing protein [Lachnospiraceae bacterium]